MPDPNILDVQDLQSGYGRSQVLFGVSLLVPRQGALAVLGRNGAGKTTLLRTIMGELPATEGRVFLDGAEVTAAPTERRVRAGVGYVPQEQAVFARLTVRENLEVGAVSAGRGRRDLDRALSAFPKLGQRLAQVAGTLSGGERKMLAIGRALLGEPRLLLLDEPTEGGVDRGDRGDRRPAGGAVGGDRGDPGGAAPGPGAARGRAGLRDGPGDRCAGRGRARRCGMILGCCGIWRRKGCPHCPNPAPGAYTAPAKDEAEPWRAPPSLTWTTC
ncbi:ATP-binding cassette domain-containing protein [Sphingomonas sp.]|uniref:ATP-binding cassette domain-containing protein n=1 Tax=Sphingomonas sp. TaxID=28214 RepID=UPI003CC5B3B8